MDELFKDPILQQSLRSHSTPSQPRLDMDTFVVLLFNEDTMYKTFLRSRCQFPLTEEGTFWEKKTNFFKKKIFRSRDSEYPVGTWCTGTERHSFRPFHRPFPLLLSVPTESNPHPFDIRHPVLTY